MRAPLALMGLSLIPLIAVACSSGTQIIVVGDSGAADSSTAPDGAVQQDGEAPAEDAGKDSGAETDLNPYGVPYPTDNLGWKARSGSVRGQRAPNVGFQGYPPGSGTLGQVNLSALYDPQKKTHDVVFIVCAGAWEVYGKATLDAIKTSTKRIATFVVLGEGTSPGQPATLSDLAKFQAGYSWATHGLDSGFKVFGPLFDTAALPLIVVIDARTMEVASAAVGGMTSTGQIDDAVNAITSRSPAY